MTEVKSTDKKVLYINGKKYKVILGDKVYKINTPAKSNK